MGLPNDPIELGIMQFVRWVDAHAMGKMQGDSGILLSEGCQKDYGCCSDSLDLISLADVLRPLIVGPNPTTPVE